jgi:iron transport multicopper oxidase
MSLRPPFLALLTASLSLAATLDIVNQQVAPDGVSRQAVLATTTGTQGGPIGPLLKFNKGDNFQVLVNNKLTDSTMRRSTSIVSLLHVS